MNTLSRGMKMVMLANQRASAAEQQSNRILLPLRATVINNASPLPQSPQNELFNMVSECDDNCQDNILDLSISQLVPFDENVAPETSVPTIDTVQPATFPNYPVTRNILNRGNTMTNVLGVVRGEESETVRIVGKVVMANRSGEEVKLLGKNVDVTENELSDIGSTEEDNIILNGRDYVAECRDGDGTNGDGDTEIAEVVREEDVHVMEDNGGRSGDADMTVTGVLVEAEEGAMEDDDNGGAAGPKKRRKANKDSWKQNVMKKKRSMGEPYTGRKYDMTTGSFTETEIAGKTLGASCACASKGTDCKSLTEEDRVSIFKEVWSLSWPQKQVFVAASVDSKDVGRRTTASDNPTRSKTMSYRLKSAHNIFKVCKTMFLRTTGLTDYFVRTYATGARGVHSYRAPTRQSRFKSAHDEAKEFLNSLPSMPSHYCRANTCKRYLEPIFKSGSHLHTVYKEHCQEKGLQPLSRQVFRQITLNENTAIFHPRKDQCDTCVSFQEGNLPTEDYELHRLKKEEAQAEKAQEKERAASSNGVIKAITIDLQAVLLSPSLKASAFYYRTKLCVHNFTFYDMTTKDVRCYVWHEGEGGLTANEFASFVVDFFGSDLTVKEYVIFSDGCNYQNRNVVLSKALTYFAQRHGIKIVHKILERGHTQMEVDSVHSTIERELRDQPVHCPADYLKFIERARKNPRPYEVQYVDHTFFLDFSNTCTMKSIRPGRKVGEAQVVDIRALEYDAEGNVKFKLRHTDDFSELQKRGESTKTINNPVRLYSKQRKISAAKYKHLQELKCVLPSDYHSFYDNLPHD